MTRQPCLLIVQANIIYSTADSDAPVTARFETPPHIPRRPKKNANGATNGDTGQNGKHSLDDQADPAPKGIKRSNPDDGGQPLKKARMADSGADDVVVVDDAGGAIVIDD
jgi:ubiquitin-like 1-activating enzyme E1 B